MRLGRKKRIALWVLGAGLVLILLIGGSMPLWLPWTLSPLLQQFGVQSQNYERHGYTQLTLHSVSSTRPELAFEAREVTVQTPISWWWNRRDLEDTKPFLEVRHWKLTIPDRTNPSSSPSPSNSPYSIFKKFEQSLDPLHDWLPRAILRDGEIQIGSSQILVPEISWNRGALAVHARELRSGQTLRAQAAIPRAFPIQIRLQANLQPLGVALDVNAALINQSLRLDGTTTWRGNPVQLAATWRPESSSIPATAHLIAEPFNVNASDLGLATEGSVRGAARVNWDGDRFTTRLEADAGTSDQTTPPLHANFLASGTTNRLRVETLQIAAPWLDLRLSQPVEIHYDNGNADTNENGLRSSETQLSFQAHLNEQPWIPLRGDLKGTVSVQGGTNEIPRLDFAFEGRALEAFSVQANQLNAVGTLLWPRLEIREATTQLESGTLVTLRGKADLSSRAISEFHLRAAGDVTGHPLPEGYSIRGLDLTGTAEGPLTNLIHQGRLVVHELHSPAAPPAEIRIDWQGAGTNTLQLQSRFAAASLSLHTETALQWRNSSLSAHLQRLSFSQQDGESLELVQSAHVTLSRSPQNVWSVRAEPIQLAGHAAALSAQGDVTWPSRGDLAFTARNLSSALLRDFVKLPRFDLDELALSATWNDGPADVNLKAAGQMELRPGLHATARAHLHASTNGMHLTDLTVLSQGQPVVTGSGVFPIRLVPGPVSSLVRTDAAAPFAFKLQAEPETLFWEQIGGLSGVSIRDPRVLISGEGTIQEPRGRLELAIRRIEGKLAQRTLPTLDDLSIEIALDRERVDVRDLRFSLDGQQASGAGQIPLNLKEATGWKDALNWSKAAGRLRVPEIRIADLSRHLPNYISPDGVIRVDIRLLPELTLEGAITLENASTRPLPNIGPVQEINASIHLAGQRFQIDSLRGLIGGERVEATGAIDLARRHAESGMPLVNVSLHGTNIPLARLPDLILRSDLDLKVSNENRDGVLVSGAVTLRDSYLLSDIKALVPGRVAQPDRRPPYFSVTAPVLSDWAVNVQVRGQQFLHIRSPFFRGDASAQLQIEGTLKEPLAVGEARVTSGVVQFPFANLRVTQGFVTLSRNDPYRPELFVVAASRTFGYDVRMEVRGPADDPILEFSSNPPLSSEQIVLMITAGELPRNELTFSNQQKAGRLAFFLGKSLLSQFGGVEGGEERLTVRSGENISQEGSQTYYIEYKLTEDWSIVGEYDRFNAFNAGVKWRFYSK